jgi:hypothetical protein
MRKVLYLGWIGFNNLGDEWMWEMFKAMSEAHLKGDEYQVIPSLPQVEWKSLQKNWNDTFSRIPITAEVHLRYQDPGQTNSSM